MNMFLSVDQTLEIWCSGWHQTPTWTNGSLHALVMCFSLHIQAHWSWPMEIGQKPYRWQLLLMDLSRLPMLYTSLLPLPAVLQPVLSSSGNGFTAVWSCGTVHTCWLGNQLHITVIKNKNKTTSIILPFLVCTTPSVTFIANYANT